MDLATQRRTAIHSAKRLELFTIALAAFEAVAALVSGVFAGSVVLVAFGTDSVIEMLSAGVVLRQLLTLANSRSTGHFSEHRAHRILAVLFFALAGYVSASAAWALARAHHPQENALGIVVSVASCVAMPLLAYAKRTSSRQLHDHGLVSLARLMSADAAETALCALLALGTLCGVSLAWLHWWWADPVASLVVVYFALREGREAWLCDSESAAK